jgi:protein-S-isoprenylcysteine O-methyltransferase Ste14
MQAYLAALLSIIWIGVVLIRVVMLKRKGIEVLNFGKLDKTDFLIPPFAFFYFYLIFANAFGWPTVSRGVFFESEIAAWIGVLVIAAALALLLWTLVSFELSFRVGIDVESPDRLITSGAFAHSRNPIYVTFAFFLIGQFLIFPNWLLLFYLLAGLWLLNRQALREEAFLRAHYGAEYAAYSARVRRYL